MPKSKYCNASKFFRADGVRRGYTRICTKLYRAENKRFSTLKRIKTGGTQPKLNVACFVVQSCLADADFVIFLNYCLIGTRQKPGLFWRKILFHPGGIAATGLLPAPQVRRPTQGARKSGGRSLWNPEWNPEGPPQNRRFCGEKQSPPFWAGFVIRRFCAAPRVRRPTQGARISGDRSLWNPEGPPQNRRFCGELPHACHFQSRISGRSWPYSAMYCLCSTSLSRMS